MLTNIRRRLAWKFFISYLIVVLVGAAVLATAATLVVPRAFSRHLGPMNSLLERVQIGAAAALFANFRASFFEALALASLAALLAAVLVSLLVSRQVVAPVQAMMHASQRIAEGHFDERVRVSGNLSTDELDELAQLALSFNQMAARLKRTETVRRELIADVTHE
ncbi:MAG TPA: HAMP domain-containing protein, partial [Anaerolineales bacterium]